MAVNRNRKEREGLESYAPLYSLTYYGFRCVGAVRHEEISERVPEMVSALEGVSLRRDCGLGSDVCSGTSGFSRPCDDLPGDIRAPIGG